METTISKILGYRLMSFRHNPAEDDMDNYIHGVYDTEASAVCALNDLRAVLGNNSPFWCVIEPN